MIEMSGAHWTKEQLQEHEDRLLRKGIILNNIEKPKINKYRNKKVEINGKAFDSKKEAARYNELVMMQKAGLINSLETQVSFPLICDTILVSTGRLAGTTHEVKLPYKLIKEYIADFTYYFSGKCNELIIEDAKGYRTKTFNLKKRLMKLVYGYEIKLT